MADNVKYIPIYISYQKQLFVYIVIAKKVLLFNENC